MNIFQAMKHSLKLGGLVNLELVKISQKTQFYLFSKFDKSITSTPRKKLEATNFLTYSSLRLRNTGLVPALSV